MIPNIQNKRQGTSLILASGMDHYQVVEQLLKQQANSNINRNNETMALMASCNVRGIIKLSKYLMLNEVEDPNIRSSN